MLLLTLGALAFFKTDKRAAQQNRQQEFEAAESVRFSCGYRYIALDVNRRDAHLLYGITHGIYKNVYFIRLPDGSIHTEASYKMLTPVRIAYFPNQKWSILILKDKQVYQYRVHLDQATYQLLAVEWF